MSERVSNIREINEDDLGEFNKAKKLVKEEVGLFGEVLKDDETEAECDVKEVQEDTFTESVQFESDVHYYNETQEEGPKVIASPPKNVWRWISPMYAQPKMTRTACTAIVGM